MSLEPPPLLEHVALLQHAGRDGRDRRSPPSWAARRGPRGRPSRTTGSSWSCSSWAATTGLNTVVPHGIDGYNRGRRALRLPAGQIHKITPEIGLHPSMGAMAKLLESRRLAVVQGVGYPNPDRSHFRSMEIWETGPPGERRQGARDRLAGPRPRCRSGAKPAQDPPGLHIGGRSLPLALRLEENGGPVGREPRKLQAPARRHRSREASGAGRPQPARGHGAARRRPAAGLHQPHHALGLRVERPARAARQERRRAARSTPIIGLARRLELIAQIIKADFGTRIFYTSLDGFDTHANQLGTHAALLTRAVRFDRRVPRRPDRGRPGRPRGPAHVQRIRPQGPGKRLAGHRPRRGGAVVPGRTGRSSPGSVGAHPSFDDLDDGDLKYHTDFRRVYASLLADWLGCPPEPIVGKGFERLPLLRRT